MRTVLTMAAAGLALVGASTARANEITILSTQGSHTGIVDLAAAFENATGHKVKVSFEGAPSLAQKLNTNANADLIATGPAQLDELSKLGKVVPDTVTPFTVAPLGVSVKAGAPKPNISTPEAFKAAMLAAKSIGYSRGCSGTHAADIMAKLGIADQLKAKTKLTGGGPVAEFLAKGDFEIGIQQNNVLVGVPGSEFVGALPASIDQPCPFSIGLMKIAAQPILARAFITYAVSPAAGPILRKSMLEPVTH